MYPVYLNHKFDKTTLKYSSNLSYSFATCELSSLYCCLQIATSKTTIKIKDSDGNAIPTGYS